jgi:hypothetical protein
VGSAQTDAKGFKGERGGSGTEGTFHFTRDKVNTIYDRYVS